MHAYLHMYTPEGNTENSPSLSTSLRKKKKTISHCALSSQILLGWLTAFLHPLLPISAFLYKHWRYPYTLLYPAVPRCWGSEVRPSCLSSKHLTHGAPPSPYFSSFENPPCRFHSSSASLFPQHCARVPFSTCILSSICLFS